MSHSQRTISTLNSSAVLPPARRDEERCMKPSGRTQERANPGDDRPQKKPRLVTEQMEVSPSPRREKLLFLLQVASDPKISLDRGIDSASTANPGLTKGTNLSSKSSNISTSQRQKNRHNSIASFSPSPPTTNRNAADASASQDDEEEAGRRQHRIDYALSVLSAGPAENEIFISRAIEEAKLRRVKNSISSLVSPQNYATSFSSSKIPQQINADSKRKPSSLCDTVPPASAAARPTSSPVVSNAENNTVPLPTTTSALVPPAGNCKLHEAQTGSVPPKKMKQARKRTFPEKLMDVLSRKDTSKAITWLPNGDSFVIVSPNLFVSDVLPNHFKEAKFESFTRKLNRWGFKRITKGTNAVAYSHELFLRDKPELCKQMSGGNMKKDFEIENNAAFEGDYDVGFASATMPNSPPLNLPMSITGGSAQMNFSQRLPSSAALSNELLALRLDELRRTRFMLDNSKSLPLMPSSSSRLKNMFLQHQVPSSQSLMAHTAANQNLKLAVARTEEARAMLAKAQADRTSAVNKLEALKNPLAHRLGSLSPQLQDPHPSTDEALSLFYNRKIQEISARYQNQLPRPATAHEELAVPAGATPNAEAILMAQRAQEKRRSYLHRIRQNLTSATKEGSPRPPPTMRRFGGGAA